MASFQQAVDEFLTHSDLERGLSANTIAAYRRDIQMFSRFLSLESKDGLDVSPADITDFMESLRQGKEPASKPLAPSTVARMLVSIRSLHGTATCKGI